jgi:hypothetical protein
LNPKRYLCSQLVALRCGGETRTVNLEEIWESGAIFETEEPVSSSGWAEFRCGGFTLCGRLTRTEPHEFGWRIEMEFSPLTPWSPERFRPDHLLDPSEIGPERD